MYPALAGKSVVDAPVEPVDETDQAPAGTPQRRRHPPVGFTVCGYERSGGPIDAAFQVAPVCENT